MKRVLVYVHTHWDREWYREFEEFRLRLIEVVDDIIFKLQNNEIPCFYFDGQTAALEDYLEIYPEKKTIIENLIKEKKLYIGPFYCSADSFLTGAEFLIRNLKIGIEYSQKLGNNNFIGYLSDTFGHSAFIPEIFNTCNIQNAILWRGLGSLPSEFVWKNLCVTYLIQGYFHDVFSSNISIDKKAEIIEKTIEKIAERSSDIILLPCGADHLKIADKLNLQIEQINKKLKNYKLEISTPIEYMKLVKGNFNKKITGELLDETKNFLLKGVYSSRIYQKQLNDKCQWDLSRIAEPSATICNILTNSKNRQNEIDYAYKKLIKNHAHDSIYGCSIDPVHNDVQRRFENTLQLTNGITKRVIRDFSENTDELRFLNLSNFEYSGLVEIETEKNLDKKYNAQLISKRKGFTDKKLFDSNQIPITEDITTIKKYLIEVKNLNSFALNKGSFDNKLTHKITNNSIENEYIKIFVEDKKINVLDKISNNLYKNFIEITDRADIGDSYNFGPLKNDKKIKAEIISSKILKKGKLQSTLRLFMEITIPKISSIKTLKRSTNKIKHKIAFDISLSNIETFAEINIKWKNKSKNHLLQAQFNFKDPIKNTHSKDLCGIIYREFDPDYDIYKHIPAARGIELKTNTAPMQDFVWAQGIGIIANGLNEYEVNNKNLNITLLRSTQLISEPKNPARGTPAGPPLDCEDLQCLRDCSAKLCINFTKNPTELYKIYEFTRRPILTVFSTKHFHSLFEIKNKNIILQALKTDKQNSLIIRLSNISENEEMLDFKANTIFKKIYITDALENKIKDYKNNYKLKPNEIITLKCTK